MPFKDKEKARIKNAEYHKKWYSNNKKTQKKWVNSRKNVIRELLLKYKETHPCNKCGESHVSCIDFHHLKNKEFNIGHAVNEGFSWKKILSEINKCVPLCKNCHAKLHWDAKSP